MTNSPKGIKDLNILVVDDEPDLGELVAFEFELVGAKVQNSFNGKDAFDKIKKNNFDVVVSDIRMPGGDGVELLVNTRNYHPKLPVLAFMTGFADITLEEAYHKGAIAVFGKPFNRKELIAAVGQSVQAYGDRWPELEGSKEPDLQANFESLADAGKLGRLRIGHGGFYCGLDAKVAAIGDTIRFHFTFNKENFKEVEGEGVVRWVRRQDTAQLPKGFGVELKKVSGPYRQQFFAYLDTLQEPAFIPKT